MTDPTIVPADLRDLKSLRALEQECFSKDAWPLLDLIYVLSAPGLVRLKAVLDAQMVGFVAGEKDAQKNQGWITTIGIREAYRRKGLAAALLSACEDSLACPSIRLCVRSANQPAINLYKKLGYYPVDVWKAYYHDRQDALVFEKKMQLSPSGKDIKIRTP
jgi:ribosomal protein S18 acetylase RimI-like enzyme